MWGWHCCLWRPTVHPHIRGEHLELRREQGEIIGSSPRLWGTFESKRLSSWTNSVHPHACGEHKELTLDTPVLTGSSPRLWGTYVRRSGQALRPQVHPHACGEHRFPPSKHSIIAGSSPRLWGTFLIDFDDLIDGWFIPTPVGNILTNLPISSVLTVHPHACGEHKELTLRCTPAFLKPVHPHACGEHM